MTNFFSAEVSQQTELKFQQSRPDPSGADQDNNIFHSKAEDTIEVVVDEALFTLSDE